MMMVIMIIVIIIVYFCASDLKLKSKVNAMVSVIVNNNLLLDEAEYHLKNYGDWGGR